MAKKINTEEDKRPKKEWSEGELIRTFKLNRNITTLTPLMKEWLDIPLVDLNSHEQYSFDKNILKAKKRISSWSEEDLKMNFISPVLELGHITDDDDEVVGYFDKIISATVEGIKLTVKSDFMLAKGTLDFFETPYFHFQEYKPYKNPSGDSMAQLLEAFLIAQEKNKNGLPLYGIDIVAKQWSFVIMEGKDYCISNAYNSVDREDLLLIISVLRKFKDILASRLLKS